MIAVTFSGSAYNPKDEKQGLAGFLL